MAITVTAPTATPIAPKREPSPAFIGARQAQHAEARQRLAEVTAALENLEKIVDGVGPSIVLDEKHVAVLTKAAKAAGVKIKRLVNEDKSVQVWVK